MSTGWIVLGVIVIIVLFAFGAYNRLVALGQRVGQAFADIDVQLKQRHDLIPNLVETVKGYAAHERGTLEEVVKARNAAMTAQGRGAAILMYHSVMEDPRRQGQFVHKVFEEFFKAWQSAGHRAVTADDAAGALAMMAAEKPDVVILDLGLPDRSGFEVIAEIRKHSPVPIIVLSARSDERSKVEALDLGADDYIGKPFGMAELMARLRAALRHAFQAQGELPMFVSGDLSVDLVRRHVTRGGREIKLSPKEFELLRHLVTHAGKVLTHRQLLREVWGPAQAEEVQYLRVFIRGLRQKLEPDPTRPTHILTELGVGYRLQLPPEQRAPMT